MNPLSLRKQLLIAESDINRFESLQDWQRLADGVRGAAHRAKSVGSLAGAAVLLAVGFSALAPKKSKPAVPKSSWFQTILHGARLASSIWLAVRTRPSGKFDERSQP